jgi:adenosylcobinamide kinase / adenosylcobinamide-phosphate guanylyltransferase
VRILVLGGIRSGKSAWAEAALTAAAGPGAALRYLATAPSRPDDADWSARVAAHRARRSEQWSTVESVSAAEDLAADSLAPTLVDDIGNWLVSVLDRRSAWTDRTAETAIDSEVDALVDAVTDFRGPLALVSPEVGLTLVPATESGRRFADRLGLLNQRLAAVCDQVVLVVAGQPLIVKETP